VKFNFENCIENKRTATAVIKKHGGRLLDWLPKRHAEDSWVVLFEVPDISGARNIIMDIGIGERPSDGEVMDFRVPDDTFAAVRLPDYCN